MRRKKTARGRKPLSQESKTTKVGFTLTEELLDEFDLAAERRGVNGSELFRQLVQGLKDERNHGITLSGEVAEAVRRLAKASNVEPEQMVENILRGWLDGQAA